MVVIEDITEELAAENASSQVAPGPPMPQDSPYKEGSTPGSSAVPSTSKPTGEAPEEDRKSKLSFDEHAMKMMRSMGMSEEQMPAELACATALRTAVTWRACAHTACNCARILR